MTKKEESEVWDITEFLLNGGVNRGWEGVDFEEFLRKITRDSLVFDQFTFEIVYDHLGFPHSFHATDSSTIRISDSIHPEVYEQLISQSAYDRKEKVNGFYPSFVQILDNKVVEEFYPWEMCFGVRNPTTDIYSNGYGLSEIEEMVAVITSLLWGHEYNRNIFRNGTIPKGFLKVSGNMNPSRLAEFRQMWYATMRGVSNSHRTPVMPADKVEWIDLQRNNRDMEFHQWMEFNIKLATGIFSIDPAECNFPMSGEAGGNKMFEAGGKYKIENSKDKGLYPLLRTIQKKINKHLIRLINPRYEFVFTGMDALDQAEEQRLLGEKVKTYVTVDEIRAERNLPPLPNDLGKLPIDPTIRNAANSLMSQDFKKEQDETNFQRQEKINQNRKEGDLRAKNDQSEGEGEEETEKAENFDIMLTWDKYIESYN